MKRYLGSLLLLALAGAPSPAESLRCDGVLGNSGEQGATLVRYSLPLVGGFGVAADSYGDLWDRGGTGTLNRYAWDGRLLGTYKIPSPSPNVYSDAIVLLDDRTLLMNLGEKLYTLPINAPPGTEAAPLNVTASHLSLDSAGGWAAANDKNDIFLVNATGEKKPLTRIDREPDLLAMGPDQAAYVGYFDEYKIYRVDPTAPHHLVLAGGMPGERIQLIQNFWYGERGGGTIRRLNAVGEPVPGVILGGATGAFLGHAFIYPEIDQGCGMAQLAPDLFAVSGGERGILHLLAWSVSRQQATPLRRIGAVPSCGALGLDGDGNVFHFGGTWKWNDGPAAPLANGVPSINQEQLIRAAVVLPNETMVAYCGDSTRAALYEGKLTGEVEVNLVAPGSGIDAPPVALASTQMQGKLALLTLQADGQGRAVFIGLDGHLQHDGGPVQYAVKEPLRAWSALSSMGPDGLVGAGDGSVVEFARDGNNWKETRRWNAWANGALNQFGSQIYLSCDAGRIWVSDTLRNRVICFDVQTDRELGVFGQTDKAGNDLASLSSPQAITARGARAVVYDSGNQRIVKLELMP